MFRSRSARLTGLIGGSIAVALLAGFAWYWHSTRLSQTPLRTEPARKGDLVATVTATGTIEPEEIVDVGAQVVGMIKEFGHDPRESTRSIDFLSPVEEGTILARIDDAVYRARLDKAIAVVEQAQAQLPQARANLRSAEANVLQMRAKEHQADRDWARAQQLRASKAITDADYDNSEATAEVSKANLIVAEATVEQERAALRVAEKSLASAECDRREAQQNLDYTIIRSPVRGVIVDRRVNVGQTVVSNMSAPSLFLIAKDLKRLQVWASVNEADVGRIGQGQNVRFTVDAFPDEVFAGQVSQVRLNATMTQNVVTYTVVVETDNFSGKLLPYLTAGLHFEVGRRQNVLLVPNAAMRWQPQTERIAPAVRQQFLQSQTSQEPPAKETGTPGEKQTLRNKGVVWVQDGDFVRPIEVRTGLSDGLSTEIVEGRLDAGQQVVVGEELAAESEEARSPFTPRFFSGKK